ncbi:MAG: prepilin-type N-terminal cleavage/methylation domain-containing protein [Planctomycetes bacterium]|nr:prepilin-type N-terminal cleavage/methylation domain-containing protein [Planctomycetota bacterium]MCB9909749.1 prepilin-type N-terminal cleavage/methylation domain-containing protein [Planctomycetota bacterium]MCB9912342.1 prepilin-type N-terminal cleavage/methylation domain-containing protein [Planctomycetota bacterium]HPF13636.1 prepilin-type N-terminal cleavage/methylation domain-containing protein [Planctomycetota bacterium]HRV80018.1 prepilin-type N-terminal cleavage/methylation domain
MLPNFQTKPRIRPRGGFTLVEVMISLAVLTVAVYLMSTTITATMTHTAKRKERTLALESAMNVLESMRAMPFRELAARYNNNPADDPEGPGTAPGATFDVSGLKANPEAAIQSVGSIVMPTAGGGVVREDVNIPSLGMPRDLNGDFVVDTIDHSDDYVILPIEIRVEWEGSGGPSHLEITSMFSAVQKHLE